MSPSASARPGRAGADSDPTTLAVEHAALLRDLRRRSAPVSALATARYWPEAELRVLTGFLRSVVLRQAAEEEMVLYPTGASEAFTQLSGEHAMLNELTERLERAEAATCPLQVLTAMVDEVVTALEVHLRTEWALLAALPDAPADLPSTAALLEDAPPHDPQAEQSTRKEERA